MPKPQTYIGIDKDLFGGMTVIGKLVRDAWVFGLIPETETCAGWNLGQIDGLLHRVNDEWDKYGCLVSHLPDDLRERHRKIYSEAMERARAAGWSGEIETNDEA